MMRWNATSEFLLALGVSMMMLGGPASALDKSSAEAVVTIVEQLNDDVGPVAYDDEEADRWFESDLDSDGLIGKAGFDQSSWKEAFDETIAGYFATIPDDEIMAAYDRIRQRTQASKAVSAQQKQMLMQMIDEQVAEMGQLRSKGRAHAAIVRPLAPRLRKLIPLNQAD